MTRPEYYTHHRTLQIMPADGWWACYAEDDGTCYRSRVVGFALVETWRSTGYETAPDPDGPAPDREVLPLMSSDMGIDVEAHCQNFLGVVHADAWDTDRPQFEVLAREYVEQRRADASIAATASENGSGAGGAVVPGGQDVGAEDNETSSPSVKD